MLKYLVLVILVINLIDPGTGRKTTSTTTECPTTTTECEDETTTTEESPTTTTECEAETTTTEECPTTTTECEDETTTTEECPTTTTECEADTTTTEECPTTTTECEDETTTTEECPTTTTECEAETTTTEECPTTTTECEDNTTTTEECPTTTTECEDETTTTECEEETTTTEECPTTTTEECSEPDYPTCSPLKGCPCQSAFNRSLTVVWNQATRSLYKLLVVDRKSPTICRSQIAIYYFLVTLCEYSTGLTYDECLNVLDLKNVDEMNCVINIFNRYFTEIGTFTKYYKSALEEGIDSSRFTAEAALVVANSNVHRYTTAFNNTCKKLIEIPVNTNYKNIQQSVNIINNLTRQYSYNEDNIDMTFPNLDDIIEGTSGRGLILLSNILFKSKWKTGFNVTYKGDFYPSPTSPIKNVIYREKTEYCLQYYSQILKAQVVIMQLQNAYSIIIMLPDPGTPYEYSLKFLSAETIDEIIQNSKCSRVSISIPQLKIIDTIYNSRQNQMMTNGNKTYYNEKQAMFSGIDKNDKPVWIEAGFQRCVVVETYKQASSKSVSEGVCKAPASGAKGPLVVMDCTRPFIFIIIKELSSDCKTGCKPYPIPIISGVVRNIVPGSQ